MQIRGRGWAFIDLADLGVNSARSYVFTLLRVILLPLVFLIVAFTAIFIGGAMLPLPEGSVPAAVVVTAFASVIVAGLALIRGVTRSHRRPWRSLISPELTIDWRRLAIGAGVEGVLLLLSICLAHLLAGRLWPPGSSLSWPALVMVLLLVPFQAASEEMLFRGYLTQAFGRLSRSRVVIAPAVSVLFRGYLAQALGRFCRSRIAIALAVSVLFAALHFGAYGSLTMPYLMALSLIYSGVSLQDERIELTIGAHTMTNWAAIGVADALSKTDVQLDWTAVTALIVNGALFYGITKALVRRFCTREASRP
jgi:membrane protease YdiL (CAAX protease family)